MTLKRERSRNLDNVKWILTLLIVLYHISYMDVNQGNDYLFFMFIKNFGDCVVPAFTLISGYLFWRNVDSMQVVKTKMYKRIYTLLIPYLLWNIINSLMFRDNIDILHNIIFWDSSPHFWYIFMLIVYAVIAPVLYYVYKRNVLIVFMVISQLVYIFIKGDNILHSRFIWLLYTWGGLCGVMLPSLIDKMEKTSKDNKVYLACGSVLLYLLLGVFMSGNDISMGLKVWLYAVRGILLIVGMFWLPLLPFGKMTDFKYSFWLFAIHYWLDAYVESILWRHFPPMQYQFLTWMVVIVIGLILGAVIYRFMPKMFGVLNGNR
ncbi:acyltransferase family protein [Selenomonas caprae]|uniref:acyltransferase family protein n=1 Tax=Selenomonas caprae TaxID=2606905 RepID=UPI0016559EF5|nr:acyltransferase [Selenomonas caprae]